MARAIPVQGPMGPEESYSAVMMRLFYCPRPRQVSWEHFPDGRVLLSYLDVTEINPVASELAGKTVYGDAMLYKEGER